MKVFISHAEENREIAEKLYDDLKKAGANPWMETKDLRAGANKKIIIHDEISKSRYFIALLSSKSLSERGFVQKEMKKALHILDEMPEDGIFIIPVRIDDCIPMNEELQSRKTADLFPSYEQGLAEILKTLGIEKDGNSYSTLLLADKYPPVRHNLPQPNYEQFIGRKYELQQIEELLSSNHRAWAITIDGVGGIGKSALALEVAEKYRRNYYNLPQKDRFEAIIWTTAKRTILTGEGIMPRYQSISTIDDIYNSIAIALENKEIISECKKDDSVRKILTQQRTLLVIDNFETIDDDRVIAFILEIPLPTKVIVTTRHRIDVAYPIRLTGMPEEDALNLINDEIKRKGVDITNEQKKALYRRTGGVPLAIVWSISQMAYSHEFDAIFDRLGRQTSDIARYCFESTIEYIRNKPAYKLLLVLSSFENCLNREELGHIADLPELDRDEGLVELERLSLINKRGKFFSLLPLTRIYCREELSKVPDLENKIEKSYVYKIVPNIYKERLNELCRYMDISKLREEGQVIQVQLPEIFISLYTDFPSWNKNNQEFQANEPQVSNIEELIAEKECLLIEGEAGSGKTTLLKHFAYSLLNENKWKKIDGWLPMLIFLRDVKEIDLTKVPIGVTLAEYLIMYHLSIVNHMEAEMIKRVCGSLSIVILLDGLDEISSDLRDKVVDTFAEFLNNYKNCKIVFSGRPHGISGGVVERFGHRHIRILSMSMKQTEEFIRRWFRFVYHAAPKLGETTATDMIGEIRAHPGVARLIDNPLMLTAICILYHDGKELPGQRAELYKKFVNNMLSRRFSEPEKVRYFLMALASEMHTKRSRGIDRSRAVELLSTIYPMTKEETEPQYKIRIEREFDTIEPNSGLLKIEGGQYNFRHLTFQEFFTAIGIVDKETDYTAAIRGYWDDEWYREVIELYIGYLSIENRVWANDIVREILEQDEQKPFYRLRLACRALLDIHENTREPGVVGLARKKLLSVFGTDVEPKARADAGEILGWLGDPRDLEVFIPVRGGKYELSTGTFEIQPFEMSKYPVTNQWYAKFIKDGGYDRKDFWTEEGLKWLDDFEENVPRFWYDRKWNCPNAPVVGVNWYEAAAFAKWLTITKDDGNMYRLPDENEWEAAAAGFEKREYAYGNKFDKNRSNAERVIDRTSSVGIFISGDTPEGISDLSGNVWEWTISDYHQACRKDDFPSDKEMMKLIDEFEKSSGDRESELRDEYISKLNDTERSFPVLRGGGWDYVARSCRAAYRIRYAPDGRNYDSGFRLVRLPQVSRPA